MADIPKAEERLPVTDSGCLNCVPKQGETLARRDWEQVYDESKSISRFMKLNILSFFNCVTNFMKCKLIRSRKMKEEYKLWDLRFESVFLQGNRNAVVIHVDVAVV